MVDTHNSVSIGQDGEPLLTEKAIFVMAEDGKIYLSKNYAYGKFHHSSFLSGNPVAVAGEVLIKKGVIKIITNGSGHYKPNLSLVQKNILEELDKRNYFGYTNKQEQIKFITEF